MNFSLLSQRGTCFAYSSWLKSSLWVGDDCGTTSAGVWSLWVKDLQVSSWREQLAMPNDAPPKRRKVIFLNFLFSPEPAVPHCVLERLLEASEHRDGRRFDYFSGPSPVRKVVVV